MGDSAGDAIRQQLRHGLAVDRRGRHLADHRPDRNRAAAYNPGGEIAMWISRDEGRRWQSPAADPHSPRNHTYVRRPVNAHPDFYALWADGHGRQPSESRLYFCDRRGQVRLLPPAMTCHEAVPGQP